MVHSEARKRVLDAFRKTENERVKLLPQSFKDLIPKVLPWLFLLAFGVLAWQTYRVANAIDRQTEVISLR